MFQGAFNIMNKIMSNTSRSGDNSLVTVCMNGVTVFILISKKKQTNKKEVTATNTSMHMIFM